MLAALAASSGMPRNQGLRAQEAGDDANPANGVVSLDADVDKLREQITTLLEQQRFAEVEELTRQILVRSAELTQLAVMATALNTRLRGGAQLPPADPTLARGGESSDAEPERSSPPPSSSPGDARGRQAVDPDAESIPDSAAGTAYGGNIQLDLIQLADAYNVALENHEVAQLEFEESRRRNDEGKLTDNEFRLAHVRHRASERKLAIVRRIVETAIGTAESDVRSFSEDHEWRKRLRAKGYISAEDLDASQRQVQEAKTRLEILRAVVGEEQAN
jgi:hypothetical protein